MNEQVDNEAVNPVESERIGSTDLAEDGRDVGELRLPFARVKRIVKADPIVKGTSRESVCAIGRAAELFVTSLARESYRVTARHKRKTINYADVAQVVSRNDNLMFLDDIIPLTVSKKRRPLKKMKVDDSIDSREDEAGDDSIVAEKILESGVIVDPSEGESSKDEGDSAEGEVEVDAEQVDEAPSDA